MAIKYQRDKFYDDVEVNGFLEKDFLSGYFQKFKIIRPMINFKISRQFIQRPDLLSMKLYGKISYWPIIGYVNDIHDWWNDLKVEDVIQVPNIRDIEDWYVEVKKLKKNKEV
jgi:hypothetical protein